MLHTSNEHYLKTPFLPVKRETTQLSLDVEGQIPQELDGLYVRNGPNHASEIAPHHHYFSGHGMVHGVRIKDGKALWYRNRFIRAGDVPQVLGEADLGGPIAQHIDASPNTNVVLFGDKMYATIEAGPNMVELTPHLDSVTRSDLSGTLTHGFTGHHKVDPENGDIHAVVYNMHLGGQAQYLRMTPDGQKLNEIRVPLTGATQIHDMAITENYAIILDLNVVFDPSLADRTTLPITWSGEKPCRVGVVPKNGTAEDIRWFAVEPCYVYHPLNAFETPSGDVVVDVSRYPRAAEKDLYGPLGDTLPTIDRWTLPMSGNTNQAKEERLSDIALDFPRVAPGVQGRGYRYGYTVIATLDPSFEGAVKLDLAKGTSQHQSFGGGMASEMSFVPRAGGTEEDDGWLIGFVFDRDRAQSRLVILNAQDFDGAPQASIWIPESHVPIGTHGDWYPGFGGA